MAFKYQYYSDIITMSTRGAVQRLTRAESQQLTRRRLIEAARRLFAERGYSTTSIQEIADAAGYTTGALYSNFPSKANLFLALLDDQTERVARELRRALSGVTDPISAITNWLQSYGRRERGLALAVTEFQAVAVRDPLLRQGLARRNRTLRSTFADVTTEVMKAMGVPAPAQPEAVVALFLAITEGLALQRFVDPKAISDDFFVNTVRTMAELVSERRRT